MVAISKVGQYLIEHPAAIDLCYLLLTRGKTGITPTEAAEELGLSVQTTSNALIQLTGRNLPGQKPRWLPTILDRAHNDQNRYVLKDSKSMEDTLNNEVLVAELLTPARTMGRAFPMLSFSRNFEKVAQAEGWILLKDIEDLTVFDLPLPNDKPIIMISRINDRNTFLAALGKILLGILRKDSISGILMIMLVNPNLRRFDSSWVYKAIGLSEPVSSMWPGFRIIIEHPTDIWLTQRQYAQVVARGVKAYLNAKL